MGMGGIGADGGGMGAIGNFGGGMDAGGMSQPAAATGGNDSAGSLKNMFAQDSFTPCASGG